MNEFISCSNCGNQNNPFDASFCGKCGTLLISAKRFQKRVDCKRCKHFREEVRISDVLLKEGKPSLEVYQEIVQIRNSEIEQKTAEACLKADLIRSEQLEWGFRPETSAYCGAEERQDIYEIFELQTSSDSFLELLFEPHLTRV